MILRARELNRRLERVFDPHDPNDVVLNQPGRALARCILWSMTSLAFVTLPLGLLSLQMARIDALNNVFANVAGLFLSGVIWELVVLLVAAIWLVAFPVLGRSRVPRRSVKRPRDS